VLELSAYVYRTGDTSLEVRVDAQSRDPRENERRQTTAACFTMVAVDADGAPASVPEVAAETDRGERMVEQAPC
jgi:acyl-CoA hydrolase